MTPFICAGCQEPIMERYLMKVLDKSWHVQCVKCSDCHCLLSEKCFSRDSKLYCRNDFFKRYGTRCAGCSVGLCPEDLVRRAVNKVYHVQCFVCSLCRKQLSTGEQLYLVQGERFLCERCYQLSTQSAAAAAGASSIAVAHTPLAKTETPKYTPPSLPHSAETPTTPLSMSTPSPSMAVAQQQQQQQQASGGKRTKSRTSLTPQQLDVLIQTYNQEQHPSKVIREELVAKTGLDMKVITVWFQNRRSKERRDASYREAMKEEPISHAVQPPALPSVVSAPITLPLVSTPQSLVIASSSTEHILLPSTAADTSTTTLH